VTIQIPNIFKEEFTVYRRTAGGYVSGRWVEAPETSFTVKGTSQPLIGSELNAQLLLMPEGERKKEMRKFYTDGALKTVDQPNKIAADQIDIGGFRFEVHTIHSHSVNSSSHMKVILVKVSAPQ